MDTLTTPAGLDSWREVIALLVEAADRGYDTSQHVPAWHSTALAADNLASAAIALLPHHPDADLDSVAIAPALIDAGPAELLRAAELATRRLPVEEFPVGASGVIVALCDLAAETGQ